MSLRWLQHCVDNNIDVDCRTSMKLYHRSLHETPRNEDGSIAYVTQQHHKDECDINLIIKRYPVRVQQAQVAMAEAKFADVTGMDYQKSINLVMDTRREFLKLDPELRAKFDNDPAKYLDFLAKPTQAKEDITKIVDEPKRAKGKKESDKKIEEIESEKD